jgi:hypothetical protein
VRGKARRKSEAQFSASVVVAGIVPSGDMIQTDHHHDGELLAAMNTVCLYG